MIVSVRNNAWYGDNQVDLHIPANWKLTIAAHHGAPSLNDTDIETAIRRPIGSKSVQYLSAGKKNVIILVEDITRPTPCETIFKVLLNELNITGVEDTSITVIVANGTHRPMTRHELLLKLGEQVYRRVKVIPHNCYDNLKYINRTQAGTDLYINSVVAAADLLIGVGGVYPHGMAGYSGGAKIVLPGVAGIQSIEQNHRIHGIGYGCVDANPIREDMEEAARMVGLSFIVNAVVNGERSICGLFAGDPVQAHRAASRFADDVYRTVIPVEPEVAVLNAYPMDTDLFQAGKAFGVSKKLLSVQIQVLLAGCPDGFGYHALCGPGGRFNQRERDTVRKGLEGRQLIICSKNVEIHDIRMKYPDNALLCRSWEQGLEVVKKKLGCGILNVALFPMATIQLPALIKKT